LAIQSRSGFPLTTITSPALHFLPLQLYSLAGNQKTEVPTVMMPKGQVKFLVVYCIFMLLFTQFLKHSHQYQTLLEPFAALFGSLLPVCISALAIKNGWAMGRIHPIDRDESPISFWLLVAMGFGIGAYLIYRGVLGLASLP
jgi:hypothetical protein